MLVLSLRFFDPLLSKKHDMERGWGFLGSLKFSTILEETIFLVNPESINKLHTLPWALDLYPEEILSLGWLLGVRDLQKLFPHL